MARQLTYRVTHNEDGSLLLASKRREEVIEFLQTYLGAHPDESTEISLKIFMGKKQLNKYEGVELLSYLEDNAISFDDDG